MTRAAVAFPGPGSYGPASLRSLPSGHAWVRRADDLRGTRGLAPLSEVDHADRFDPALHLRPVNAWPLVFVCGLLDAERIADDHEVVAVLASSTGWYTALAASGALGFDDAFRLVQEMAIAAEMPLPDDTQGAALIYPLTDDAWRPVPERRSALDAAIAAIDGAAVRALELGAFTVVAGEEGAVGRVRVALPAVRHGAREYPMRLAARDAWHTPLREEAAREAADGLGDLTWERPNVTLMDGRGGRFTPWSTDPQALARETLSTQPVNPYDFVAGFRVALRDYAPEVVLLPGPGSSLGAACAQIITAEGYRGIRSRAEFEAAQAGPAPILLSMRR